MIINSVIRLTGDRMKLDVDKLEKLVKMGFLGIT